MGWGGSEEEGDDGEEEEEEEGVRRKGEGWARAKNSAGVTGGGRVLTRSKEEGGVVEVGVCRWDTQQRGEKKKLYVKPIVAGQELDGSAKKKQQPAISFTYCSLWPR